MIRILMAVVAMLGAVVVPAVDLTVEYEIEVELDPETHKLYGSERLRWVNNAEVATDELWFHLYLNAFANDQTTFLRGVGRGTLRGNSEVERQWGWTRIRSLRLADGQDLLGSLTFERPDDGNEHDHTVARLALDYPVEPGASVELLLEFEAQLPRVIARTGWAGQFHLVGQWFPKLGVYEPAGRGGRIEAGWNCHQFHPATEFYADFGRYRVQVTVPEDYVVAASGVQLEQREVAEGVSRKRVHTFTADRVHDFAWCAAPESLMAEIEADFDPGRDVPAGWLSQAQKTLGMSAAELELPPVHLRLLVPRSQLGLGDRMVRGARLAIAWYGLYYGPFPHPQLTVVSPPPGAEEAAGMEYPTFITSGGSRLLEYPPFSWLSVNETVTVHEFGHQYFQGLLASNEFEQAWLDEGFTSYSETSCMAAIAEHGLVPEIKISNPWASKRLQWARRQTPLQIDQRAWRFRTRDDYGLASYTKTALTLKTLEGLLGPEVFARALRSYADEWRFRHPTGEDFFAAMNAAAGEDLGWFFDQAIRGDATVDWGIARVRQRAVAPIAGAEWREGEWVDVEEDDIEAEEETSGDDTTWRIRLDVVRRGEFVGPVEILLVYADGSEQRRVWDGRDRWTRYEFEALERLTSVAVDPDGVWALEGRRADNYWRDEPDPDEAAKKTWWAAAAIKFLTLTATPWS